MYLKKGRKGEREIGREEEREIRNRERQRWGEKGEEGQKRKEGESDRGLTWIHNKLNDAIL